MYKEDLALNNLQELTCHKNQPNQTNSSKIRFRMGSPSNSQWLVLDGQYCQPGWTSTQTLTISNASNCSAQEEEPNR